MLTCRRLAAIASARSGRATGESRNSGYWSQVIPSFASAPPWRWDLRCSMSSVRAIRYRRLALAQQDKTIADLLLKLADECDRGTLCPAQWRSARPFSKKE